VTKITEIHLTQFYFYGSIEIPIFKQNLIMSEHKVTIEHMDGMAFKSEVNGHEIIIDADAQFGGTDQGPRPKPLLLLSLIGCTGMDVVSLLKKMRVEYDDFKVSASGEMADEHPRYYKKITVEYQFWGKNIDRSKVEKAVNLSQERYCGVNFMLAKSSEMIAKIIYHV
jgi:putative redox protein